jgi:hypothetical protein
LPLGIVYGIWAACGVAAAAVASRWLFKERLTPLSMTGIAHCARVSPCHAAGRRSSLVAASLDAKFGCSIDTSE